MNTDGLTREFMGKTDTVVHITTLTGYLDKNIAVMYTQLAGIQHKILDTDTTNSCTTI